MAAAGALLESGRLVDKSVAWPPLAVAGGRGFIAPPFWRCLRRAFRFTWWPPRSAGRSLMPPPRFFSVTATKLTTAANRILLQYTAPSGSRCSGHGFSASRATRRDWLTIGDGFGGMGLFSGEICASRACGQPHRARSQSRRVARSPRNHAPEQRDPDGRRILKQDGVRRCRQFGRGDEKNRGGGISDRPADLGGRPGEAKARRNRQKRRPR